MTIINTDNALLLLSLASTLALAACMTTSAPVKRPVKTADPQATVQTQALYRNLHSLSGNHLLFGHQDTLAYGVEWSGEPGRSDVKDVTGSYPAVYGWELGGLETGAGRNIDNVDFRRMQEWIRQAYRRGGVVTIAWHMSNPVTGDSAWSASPQIERMLPGGDRHEALKAGLDRFVEFNSELTVTDGGETVHIPVIFRPWHEHTGDWFWWGKGHIKERQYVALWRFTVEYLRGEKNVHNLLYAYAPDRSRIDINNFEEGYLYGYPGDDYVDVMGLDNYWDVGHPVNDAPADRQREYFARSLQHTADIARKHNKLPALTETGLETVPDPDFWTGTLLAGILANESTRRIAYAQVWRNANREKENRDHFYAPYPGHPGAEDFVRFYRHPFVLFEDELPELYQ